MTGIDGKCSINDQLLTRYLAENAGGVLKILVKAHNYYPDSANITIATGITTDDNAEGFSLVQVKNRFYFKLVRPMFVRAQLYNTKGVLLKTMKLPVPFLPHGMKRVYLPVT
jgi:hypothetical protein